LLAPQYEAQSKRTNGHHILDDAGRNGRQSEQFGKAPTDINGSEHALKVALRFGDTL
jgi:hypothetical protein